MLHALQHTLAKQVLTSAPTLTRHSLAILPKRLKQEVMAKLVNLAFGEQLANGELDFLAGKWVGISVLDIGLDFAISLSQGLQPTLILRALSQADVTFSGKVPELLLIASGKEDPDSLFFQRKLLIEGDTELGLEVKNLLLAIELDALPTPLRISIAKLAQGLESLKLHSQAS